MFVQLYVRDDLNIRSTANYLIAMASNIKECQPFVRKYFKASIRLPSDWLEVAAFFLVLPDKSLKGHALPTCLRKAMIEKFPDFDAYQLGKYNKERTIKRKQKKLREQGGEPSDKKFVTQKKKKKRARKFFVQILTQLFFVAKTRSRR